MGNIDCCSDRSANPPLLSKYERPDFYKHCQTSNTARFQTEDDGLRNAMLESMRLSYTEQKLKDVEFHLMKKFKTESNNSSTIKTRRERSSSRGSERATWIRIVKVEKVESVIPCFAKENLQNFSSLPNIVIPHPFDPYEKSLVCYMLPASIKNIQINPDYKPEYIEVRLGLPINDGDLEKNKKGLVGCLNSLFPKKELLGFFINKMKEYVFVFYKNERPQASLEASPFLIECLNNAPLTQKFLEENINNATKKGQEFKGAILLYASEKKYSWILIYKKLPIVTKIYAVSTIDCLNLKVEFAQRSLSEKIQLLAEIENFDLVYLISDFIEQKMLVVYSRKC